MSVILIGLRDEAADRLARLFPDARLVDDPRSLSDDDTTARLVIHDVRFDGDPADSLERATYGTWEVFEHLRPAAHIVLSSMRMFDAYDPGWAVTEHWHPRPTTDPEQLVPYLGELAVRELTRVRPVDAAVLRLQSPSGAIDDAESSLVERLARDLGSGRGLQVRHADTPMRPGRSRPVASEPATGPRDLPRPRNAVLFGAGGPLGAAVASAAAGSLPLVLTDLVPLEQRAAAGPQTPGAPLPSPTAPPNTEALVDVSDAAAVSAVAAGADCLINCTVIRGEPAGAFRVNLLGAYAVMRAAVEHGIRRVVHTGPAFVVAPHPYGYADDRGIEGPVPPRAGDDIYLLTKLLALELCRVFAEEHGIACPALLFIQMVDPVIGREDQAHPFIVSWADAGRAIVAAALVDELPQPFTVLQITVRAPHGRFGAGDAWTVLGIQPQDRLDHLWYHDAPKARTT